MITIEKSNKIQDSLQEFYKAVLPSESYQRRKNLQIMATEEDSFHRNVSKPFLDYMRLKIIQDIRGAVIKAKTTPTVFTEFVDWEDISTKGKQLSKPAYVKVLDKSGSQAAVIARVEAGFDVMNVNSIKWAEKYSAEMVTEVTKGTKKALREIITDGMKHKYNKLKIARRINKLPIGLNLPQTQALHNFRDKLVADGVSAKLVEKRAQSYYNRLLRQRSRSIARTETSRAVNEGYLQGLEQQNVYRRVKISMAADACHLCTEHENRIFTIAEAHAFLPIHPHCRCAWVVVWSKRPGFMPPIAPLNYAIINEEKAEKAYKVNEKLYEGYAKKHGLKTAQEYRSASEKLLKKSLAESSINVNIDKHILDKIVKDGRFKSQFEVGKSRGMFAPDTRKVVEKKLFATSTTIEDRLRPIYGYLEQGKATPIQSFALDHYGPVKVVLKKSAVASRTTFVCNDSLGVAWIDNITPQAFNKPSALVTGVDIIEKSGKLKLIEGAYTEAQIHGGLEFSKATIEKVYVKIGDVFGDTLKALKDLGIKVEVIY